MNRWTDEEVRILMCIFSYDDIQRAFESTTVRENDKVWQKIVSLLAELGVHHTAKQCREKLKKLKQDYKKIKDHNNRSGSDRRTSKWYYLLDAILGHRPPYSGMVTPTTGKTTPDEDTSPAEDEQSVEASLQPSFIYAPTAPSSPCLSVSSPEPTTTCHKDRGHSAWMPEEVQVFLTLWADPSIQEQLSTMRNERVFTHLSNQLASVGFHKTPHQCRIKVKKLKQGYKKNKCMKGSKHIKSRWFAIMDSVLDPGGERETNDSKEVESPAVLTHPGSSEDQRTNDNLRTRWTLEEVHVLLAWWAEGSIQEQLTSTVGHKKVYAQLSSQLATLGFDKTPSQCWLKVKKLKQEYKRAKDQKDSKHKERRWFAILDKVLGYQGLEAETEEAAEVMDSAPVSLETSQHGFPEMAEDLEVSQSGLFSDEGPSVSSDPSGCEVKTATAPLEPTLQDVPLEDNLRTRWTLEEVHVLLAWWAEGSIQEQLTSTVGHKKVYAQLSSQLATLGFDKTPSQCRLKVKKLKQEYKRTKDKKYSKQRERTWFAVLDKVLGYQGLEAETEEAAEVMDSAPLSLETSQHGFPEMAEDLGGCLTFSALSLVVPTLRLMCAFAWQVVQHCNVMHYGKVEELVRLVTEMVPEVLTPREKVHLLFKLRARLVLELCRSESTANPLVIQPHLKVIHNLPNGSNYDQEDAEELEKSKFVEIVHKLLKDPEERNTFFKEVFPVHYGQLYEATLHTLVWKFISRLDELLPVPDVKQTAEWLSTAPSVMEECGQLVLEQDQLKTLLHCHHRHPRNTTKPKPRRFTSEQINSSRSKGTRYCKEPISDRYNKDEGHSDHSREEEEEEEPAEENQSDDEWTLEDCSKRSQVLEMKDKPRKGPSPVKHSDFQRIAPLRLYTCSLCLYSHSEVASLLQHIRKEHLVKQSSHPASDAPETDGVPAQAETEICIDATRSKIHACNQCTMVFKKLSALTRHIATHTLPFRCNHCEKRYTCKAFLDKHQRVHTGERPYTCSHCGRAFMCQYTLKAHVRTHTGDRPYKCHICGKTSIQHQTRHMLMHKGEKNYLCTECGKAFLSSGELRLHMRYHTGERPYTCKQCGKGFIAKCHLTIHMRSHTGERPYSCTECPKSFPTSNLRKRHMFIHYDKKPFQCFKCGKGFTQARTMKIHIRTRRCK